MGHDTKTRPEMRKRGWILCTEAARKLRYAPQTIYRWIEAGKVRGKTVGYRRYVSVASLKQYLEGG